MIELYEKAVKAYHLVKKEVAIVFVTASLCAVLEDNDTSCLWVVGVIGSAMFVFAVVMGVMEYKVGKSRQ